jgi:hypothetical protein
LTGPEGVEEVAGNPYVLETRVKPIGVAEENPHVLLGRKHLGRLLQRKGFHGNATGFVSFLIVPL